MAIIRKKELRKLEGKDFEKKLGEMRLELAKEKASVKIGASVTSPGKIREVRKTIARALTVKKEREIKSKKEREGGRKSEGANLRKDSRLQSKL
jgi:large subunit ribosomal protein L29